MKKLVILATALTLAMSPYAMAAKKSDESSSPAATQSAMKIGVIDVRSIMEKSDDVKNIEAELEKEFKPKMEQVKALEQGLREDVEKLNRNKEVMSESERTRLEQQIQANQKEYYALQTKFQKESSEKQQKMMQEFFDKMNDKVSVYAKKHGYDLVLISDAVPYKTDQVEITDAIMEALKEKA